MNIAVTFWVFIIPSDANIAVQSSNESSDADIADTDRSATYPAREVANARFAPLASSRKVKRIKNVLVKSRYSQDSFLFYLTNRCDIKLTKYNLSKKTYWFCFELKILS